MFGTPRCGFVWQGRVRSELNASILVFAEAFLVPQWCRKKILVAFSGARVYSAEILGGHPIMALQDGSQSISQSLTEGEFSSALRTLDCGEAVVEMRAVEVPGVAERMLRAWEFVCVARKLALGRSERNVEGGAIVESVSIGDCCEEGQLRLFVGSVLWTEELGGVRRQEQLAVAVLGVLDRFRRCREGAVNVVLVWGFGASGEAAEGRCGGEESGWKTGWWKMGR
ncbi:hypothetical protein DFP73DRAFT_601604 [Morchella snyderi]|nr:hypothetical protein DFP73DRAFT_601604 [Morchella snyderi]